MKKRNTFIVASVLASVVVVMSACSNPADDALSDQNQLEDDLSQSNESPSDRASNTEKDNQSSEETTTEHNGEQADEIQEATTTNMVTKIEGRKTEFLDRLDNIQKELDALPEKEDSDNGITNAMINYYGRSYEMYDKELNEIYALLKTDLSPDIMKDLKTEQIKWIEQKEAMAEEERLAYQGGTFETVAGYISLYESTKDRCYELVNEYMID